MTTVIIFAGGDAIPLELLGELPVADYSIAADSGLLTAKRLGFRVDVIVGDMDSLPQESIPTGVEVIRHPEDKDSTDLELAFELAVRRDPQRIVLVGAEGGRLDHELGAVAVVCSDRWAGVPEIDWVRKDATCSVIRGLRRLQGDRGSLVSLLAVGGDAVGVSTLGLKWALEGETLYYGSSRGMSNRIVRPEFSVTVESGVVLAILAY